MSNRRDEVYQIRCAACKELLGIGTWDDSEPLCLDHAPLCPATKEEHEKALNDVKFMEIIQNMDNTP
jgi:hypothetical protein